MTAATTVYAQDRQLRPCPFCGGEAKLAARWTRQGWIAFVACTFCEAQTRIFSLETAPFDQDTFDDPAFTRAATRWQRREGGNDARP